MNVAALLENDDLAAELLRRSNDAARRRSTWETSVLRAAAKIISQRTRTKKKSKK